MCWRSSTRHGDAPETLVQRKEANGVIMPSAAFEKAAEISRNSKVSVSMDTKLRGYGLYKLVTTGGKKPDEKDLPSIANLLQIDNRQKWFAHEAAYKECGDDVAKAEELYIAFTEQTCNVTIDR